MLCWLHEGIAFCCRIAERASERQREHHLNTHQIYSSHVSTWIHFAPWVGRIELNSDGYCRVALLCRRKRQKAPSSGPLCIQKRHSRDLAQRGRNGAFKIDGPNFPTTWSGAYLAPSLHSMPVQSVESNVGIAQERHDERRQHADVICKVALHDGDDRAAHNRHTQKARTLAGMLA